MNQFEIDVGGSHPFEKDYTVVVAENGNKDCLLAHKFTETNQRIIRSKWGQGAYKYPTSQKGGADIKLRLYCATIYYIFKTLKEIHKLKEVKLKLCNDFDGNQWEIQKQLTQLLNHGLKFNIKKEDIEFSKLPDDSIAHIYAKKIRRDKEKEYGKFCKKIELDEFEAFLKL